MGSVPYQANRYTCMSEASCREQNTKSINIHGLLAVYIHSKWLSGHNIQWEGRGGLDVPPTTRASSSTFGHSKGLDYMTNWINLNHVLE